MNYALLSITSSLNLTNLPNTSKILWYPIPSTPPPPPKQIPTQNVEKLLKVNEDAQALALLFKRMKSGALSLLAGKMQIRSLGLSDSEKSPANGKGLSTAAAMLARSLSRSSSGIILPSYGGGVSRSSSGPIGRSGSSSRDQHDPDSIRSREGSFDSPGGGLPLRSASVDSGLPLSGERGIRLGFPTCKPGTPGGGTGTGTGTRIPGTSTGTSPVISPPGSRHGTQPSSAQGSRHTSRSSSKDEDDDRDHHTHHRHHDADPSRYHARAGSVEDSIGFKDRASSFDEEDGPLGNAGHTAAYNDGQQRRHHHHQRQQQHDRVVSTRSGVDAVELVALLEQGAHIEGEVDDYGRWIHKTNDHHAPPFDRRSPAKPSHSAAPAPAPSPAPAPAPAALDGVTSLPLPAGAARVLAAHDSDASEVIVHERDPFAPEALDALFTAGSASKAPHHGCGHGHQQRERSTGQRPRKELDSVREDDGNVGTGTGTGNGSSDHRGGGERNTGEDRSNEAEAEAATQDPFAAEALDALFVSKTVGSADTYEDSGKYSQRSPATRPQQHPQQQRQPQHPPQPPYRGDNRPHQQQQQYYQEHHRDHPHYQQQHGFNERMNAEEAAHHRYGAQAHPHLQAQTVHPSREQSPNPPQRHAPISAAGTARAPAARSTADRQGTHSPYPTEHRSRSPGPLTLEAVGPLTMCTHTSTYRSILAHLMRTTLYLVSTSNSSTMIAPLILTHTLTTTSSKGQLLDFWIPSQTRTSTNCWNTTHTLSTSPTSAPPPPSYPHRRRRSCPGMTCPCCRRSTIHTAPIPLPPRRIFPCQLQVIGASISRSSFVMLHNISLTGNILFHGAPS